MSGDEESRVQATVTANAILDCVTRYNGATLTEIANEMEVATSTAHRHVNTLLDLGFLVKDDKQYLPGFRPLRYACAATTQFPIARIAWQELERVAEITNEQASVYLGRNDRLYELLRVPPDTTDDIADGETEPLYTTAPGKVIIAYEEWEDVRSLPGITDRREDLNQLREELGQIRVRELDIERNEAAGRARVAVPILVRGDAVASLCVSGPTNRLSGKRLTEDVPGLLRSASKAIELQLAPR
ncbi:IclR family transcriptional regulator [Halomicrobium salinisoli]|uniref:IclR family transcriptional regulator n=1 Tax=Halomicrobium salinisoli TaxID=2878391 RepID=UPI001CF0D476|nr:IclR family transcriptional regulator C-terminal domain-containing protein [Halomicrobium salinisoli]